MNVICNQYYVFESKVKCYRCNNETSIIAFGVTDRIAENFSNLASDGDGHINTDLILIPFLEGLPEAVYITLCEIYNYKLGYSKTRNLSLFANHCSHCDSIQGEFFCFRESRAPFRPCFEEDYKKITLHKIKLKNDFISDLGKAIQFCNPPSSEFFRYGKVVSDGELQAKIKIVT